MEKDKGRKAVVMGATSGIGAEVVKELASRGWQVGVAGRRVEILRQTVADTAGVVAMRRIDVTDADAATELAALVTEMGGMDLYVHCSGIGYQNVGLDMKKELDTVATNVAGFNRLVGAAFHYFANRSEPGHIAVISSIARTKGLGAAPAYSASKRYVSHYMECLQQLCTIRHIRNVRLTDIRPGFVATPLIADGNGYPMQLQAPAVARKIVRGIERGRSVVTIDWRYRILVALWQLIPRCLWVRLPIASPKKTD